MWFLYLYLISEALVEVAELGRDTFNWFFSDAGRPRLPTILDFFETVQNYGIAILVNSAAIIIWAAYNYARFQGADTRTPIEIVTVEDLASLYGFPAQDIAVWQKSKILSMRHERDGTLIGVMQQD